MESSSTGDLFSKSEIKVHINVLELKAILFDLKALAKRLTKVHKKVLTNNSTTVACINKFGTSRSKECDSITKEIWQWASDSFIWLSAHLQGIQNTEAGFESRKYEIHTERLICGKLGFPLTIDLFATRINTQLKTFASWPDPNCVSVNSFWINWEKEKCCAFPPFSCLSRTL